MLSPEEFSVGTVAGAFPLSLMLPRNRREEAILVGHIDGAAAAVFLTGQFRFHFFLTAGTQNWRGLIIPDVRIEVDESGLFDPDIDASLGCVIRTDTRLVVQGTSEHSYRAPTAITLHDELTSAGSHRAGFTKWQVVIGSGDEKRILIQVDLAPKTEN